METDDDVASSDRQRLRADHIVAMARRHAEEIRAAAEQEAEHLLQQAEKRVAALQQDRLEARRRELERMATQRREIGTCLDTAASALTQIRELVTRVPAVEPPEALPDSRESPSDPVPSSYTTDQHPRHRTLDRIVVVACAILGLWFVLMVPILGFLSNRSLESDASVKSPVRQNVRPKPLPIQSAKGLSSSGSTSSVAATQVPSAAVPHAAGLTVAFSAARECWISVATDEGMSRDRLLKASETHVVQAHNVVTFKAGNAAALSVVINGQQAGPLGGEGQVVTRRIARDHYRRFVLS